MQALALLGETTRVAISMGGPNSDRFKIVRRNSLRNEVDGCFEDLEEFEDRNEPPATNS